MGKAVWVSSGLINDFKCQILNSREFMRKFKAALRGEENEFSRHVRFTPPHRVYPSNWRSLRERVFLRDGFTCQYCGAVGVRLACDHIIPASRGGSDRIENLTTACIPCNSSKRDKTPEEWAR